MTSQAKASQNSFKRPLKTSKLNPYAMRQTGYDETRISPKIAALKGQFGKTGSGYGQGGMSLPEIAEAKANYIPRSAGKAGTREAAAEMLKRYRKTKMLSRADASAIVEFARGDQAAKFIKANKLGNMYPGTVHAGAGIENILKKDFRPNTWGSQVIPHLRQRVADEIKHERFVNNLPKGQGRALADTVRRMNEAPIMGTRKKPAPGAYRPA